MRGDDGGEGDKGDEASTGGGLLAVSLQQVVLTIAVNLQASQNLGTSTCFLSAHHDSGLAVSHRGGRGDGRDTECEARLYSRDRT